MQQATPQDSSSKPLRYFICSGTLSGEDQEQVVLQAADGCEAELRFSVMMIKAAAESIDGEDEWGKCPNTTKVVDEGSMESDVVNMALEELEALGRKSVWFGPTWDCGEHKPVRHE